MYLNYLGVQINDGFTFTVNFCEDDFNDIIKNGSRLTVLLLKIEISNYCRPKQVKSMST